MLAKEIERALPHESEQCYDWMSESLGWIPDSKEEAPWHAYFERLSQLVTDAVKGSRYQEAERCLNFMESVLGRSDQELVRFLDTYFVEPLLWDVNDLERNKQGWRLLPPRTKKLYLETWSQPSYARLEK